MFSYYTFHGGTNFGFWACNTWNSDHSFITTRYYWSSPVEEGGALDEMYFAAKSSNLLASNFREFFCEADEVPSPVTTQGPVRLVALGSSQGTMLFVLPLYPYREAANWDTSGRSQYLFSLTEDGPGGGMAHQAGVIRLPSGQLLPLSESCTHPMLLPLRFKLDEGCLIDFSNATVFGYGGTAGHRVLAMRGEPGRQGVISVNGHLIRCVFPDDEVAELAAGETKVLAMPRELADRTWFADDRIVIGPDFVGESKKGKIECWLGTPSRAVHIVANDGTCRRAQASGKPIPDQQIGLPRWRARGFEETYGKGNDWKPIDTPRSLEEVGAYYGYAWYGASYDSASERTAHLFFTNAADRVHVFLRGHSLGIWGRGPGATRDPLPVELEKGTNKFVFLCDNMGRTSEGKISDRKGITGPVYLDARATPLGPGAWSTPLAAPTNSWEFHTHRCYMGATELRFSQLRVRTEIEKGAGALLSLRWVPQYTWIYVNDRLIAEHGGDDPLLSGFCFNNYVLDPFIEDSRAEIRLVFFGGALADWTEHVHLFTYPKANVLTAWRFKPWQEPAGEAPAAPRPIWWECDIPKPDLPGPLFFVTQGLSKGQLYFNGAAAGRYWEIGPQHSLYLPEPWFKDQNRLAIFDEEGKQPDQVYIVRDSRVPAHKVWLGLDSIEGEIRAEKRF